MRTNFSPFELTKKVRICCTLVLVSGFSFFVSLFFVSFVFYLFFQLKPVATEILAREELVADGRVRNLRVKKKLVKIITKMGQYQEALRVPSNIRTQD